MRDKLISVLIPVKNCESYIESSLDSIFDQDLQEHFSVEVIVIDDGSTDRTVEVVENKFRNTKRERFSFSLLISPGAGVADALNYGIRNSQGRYVARMDGDDLSVKHRFQSQLNLIGRKNNVALIGSNIRYFHSKTGRSRVPVSAAACRSELFFAPCCMHPTYFIDRAKISPEDFYYAGPDNAAQDYELLARLSKKYEFYNDKQILLNYRVHQHQVSSHFPSRFKRVIEIAEKYWHENGFSINRNELRVLLWPEIFMAQAKFSDVLVANTWMLRILINSITNRRLSFLRFSYLYLKWMAKSVLLRHRAEAFKQVAP